MEHKLLPIVRPSISNEIMSLPVSLIGSKVQLFVARILTILEFCFVASFPDEVHPISVSAIACSISLDCDCELGTWDFSMNYPVCLSSSSSFGDDWASEVQGVM